MSPDVELTEVVKRRCTELGFANVGVASAQALEPEGEQLRAWLASGRHGQMDWMRSTAPVRCDPRHPKMVPGALSVIVMATPYARDEPPVDMGPGRVARYAAGRDYHNVLGKKANKVAKLLRERGHSARAAVDSKPVFERAWAERAGVGFVGKNCCLIVPGIGSHVFLSCVVTTAPLAADEPIARRCGQCTLCLDACPTDALLSPHELDATQCISYLTIEHRGAIDPTLSSKMGEWLFGCDACQDVCPYNHTAPVDDADTLPFSAADRWATKLAALLTMDEDAFVRWAEGSPVKRAGRSGMARNAAIVFGNSGDRRHLPVLNDAARNHDDPVVRKTAQWAVDKIQD